EHRQLRAELDRERAQKVEQLRALAALHTARVTQELEHQLEEDIARLRAAHLKAVAGESGKIQREIREMQSALANHFERETRQLADMSARVQLRKSAQLAAELDKYRAVRESVLDTPVLPKLALLARHLKADALFDDTMELLAAQLPRVARDYALWSPSIHPG